MKTLSAVYKVNVPQDSSASKICIDSCPLRKRPDNLIEKWGEDEGKLFVSLYCHDRVCSTSPHYLDNTSYVMNEFMEIFFRSQVILFNLLDVI